MKTLTWKTENGKELLFKRIENGQSTLTVDCATYDFEFHYYKELNKLTLFREFHTQSTCLLTAQLEQTLFNYLVSLNFFDLCYEDGLPCLSRTFHDADPNVMIESAKGLELHLNQLPTHLQSVAKTLIQEANILHHTMTHNDELMNLRLPCNIPNRTLYDTFEQLLVTIWELGYGRPISLTEQDELELALNITL